MKKLASYEIAALDKGNAWSLVLFKHDETATGAEPKPIAAAQLDARTSSIAFTNLSQTEISVLPARSAMQDLGVVEMLNFPALVRANKIGSVMDPAYSFVSMTEAPLYRKAAVETEDDMIVLFGEGINLNPRSGGGAGRTTPKRRKNVANVWI